MTIPSISATIGPRTRVPKSYRRDTVNHPWLKIIEHDCKAAKSFKDNSSKELYQPHPETRRIQNDNRNAKRLVKKYISREYNEKRR